MVADKYHELFNEVARLCWEVYGTEYHVQFGVGDVTVEELKQQKNYLLRKKEFKESLISSDIDQKEVKPTQNRHFLSIWREFWASYITSQETLCDLYGLCGVSQILRHVTIYRGFKEDLRLHICAIMPSGVGKSDGNDLLAIIAEEAGLRYYSVDRYTDAVLTGSIDRQAIDHNTQRKQKRGDAYYIEPYQPSILEKNDFIVYDEGENVLKPTKMTEGSQRILQKAMNRYGSKGNTITNTLVGYEVKTNPHCSVIITSYYLDEFRDVLLHRGLLQRMIVYIQEESKERREAIVNHIISELPVFTDNKSEAEDFIKVKMENSDRLTGELKECIKELKEYHKGTVFVFVKDGVQPVLKDCVYQLRDIMPMLYGQKQVWESMIGRLTVNLLKVSALFALMDHRDYITADDAKAASAIIMQTMESVAMFLKYKVETKEDTETKNISKKLRLWAVGHQMTKAGWVTLLIEKTGMKKERADAIITNLADNGKFKVIFKEDKTEKILVLE